MQVILLIIAVSVDVFVACVACGSEQIKIGSVAALCISTVCSGILGISLYAGMALQGILLKKYAIYLSFFGLLAVGIFKLAEYAIRKYIERHKFLCKKVKISFSQLIFIGSKGILPPTDIHERLLELLTLVSYHFIKHFI